MVAKYERDETARNAGVFVSKYKNLVNLPHWHNEHELILINNGPVTLMTDNGVFTLETGMCAFILGGDVHCMRSEKGSSVSVMKIEPELVKKVTGQKKLLSPVIEDNIGAKEAFAALSDEQEIKDEFSAVISESIAVRLLAEIFRKEKTVPRNINISETNERYKELICLISEKYASFSFGEAADFMCLSKPYFSKYFHRAAGMPFSRYLNTVRVSAASEMIAEGKISMTDIAIKCGFGTIRSFNRVFRELTGYSPSSLPPGYVFIRTGREENGFDPTLSCTERI